ncbi:hypothetical protein I4F81_006574 [Pyropia yezoensis]|uniref:Uncharacterized protein n=1 Tax=Pyropia yezoensis TaxID=2788 RepID=A0ACC3C1P8_PYRYE|nr:hypothetical protein I4F81_006574 [Neopyropia yezoensis]
MRCWRGGGGNGGGGGAGPVVAVVGGADVGKSTLAGLLTAWCVKAHGIAVAVEADPGEVAAPIAGMVGGVGISVVRHVDVSAGGVVHEKPLAWSYGSPGSGGVVSRGAAARRKALAARVREYFYGTAGKLCPFTVVADWADVTFVRVGGARRLPDSLLPAGEASTLERVGVREVDLAMGAGGGVVHAVCGVSQASTLGEVLSKPVWGWVHVAKVDAEKRTVTLLAPSPGRPPARYLLVGGIKWLE